MRLPACSDRADTESWKRRCTASPAPALHAWREYSAGWMRSATNAESSLAPAFV